MAQPLWPGRGGQSCRLVPVLAQKESVQEWVRKANLVRKGSPPPILESRASGWLTAPGLDGCPQQHPAALRFTWHGLQKRRLFSG